MNRNIALITALFVAGLSVHAATMEFRHKGANTDGAYHWDDPANWQGGAVPGEADVARLRYPKESAVLLRGDVKVLNLLVSAENPSARVSGTGTLTANSYFSFLSGGASAVSVCGSVRVIAGNRMRFWKGTSSLMLYDDARVDARIGFDEPGAHFTVILNGNSVFENFRAPLVTGATNIAEGSKFILNDASSLAAGSLTALQLYDGWIVNGVTFHLNDNASLTLKRDSANAEMIDLYISSGYLVINGLSSAVNGVDYTYDAQTGVLSAVKPLAGKIIGRLRCLPLTDS